MTPAKTRYLKLPLAFDVARLRDDLANIADSEWIPHFNTAAYEREWRCVPLRSLEGRSDHIISLSGVRYQDTAILDRCPYFRQVIDTFECEKTSVRLMAMGPDSVIRMHRDPGTSFEDGLARLHVPILTSPAALFTVEDEEVHFSAGGAWYLNANCLHGVRNGSRQPRIHLMLDCPVNTWLEALFDAAGFIAEAPPKYGDPSINDDNVAAVIECLLTTGGTPGRREADRLAAIRDGQPRP